MNILDTEFEPNKSKISDFSLMDDMESEVCVLGCFKEHAKIFLVCEHRELSKYRKNIFQTSKYRNYIVALLFRCISAVMCTTEVP